jgi:hypothetical protein
MDIVRKLLSKLAGVEGKFYNLPKILLPQDAKEGDVIKININEDETNKRKKNIKNLMDKLWND